MFLEGCESLESLPSSLLSWPEVRSEIRTITLTEGSNDHRKHTIFLGGSGLSRDTLEWLRAADAPFVRFDVNLRNLDLDFNVSGSRPPFLTILEAVSFWERESERQAATSWTPPPLSVLQFLSKLRGAKEFGITETRCSLAQRVIKALHFLNQPDCRTEVIQRMEDSIDACHDKPIWALNQLT
mmetsp:Transcript_6795/g.11978  ORF Transcript_6795/g.11978 Transcript_6795/m.11978 type:complete len:183 (+) Transcript_6795:680-1228(+)